jgi:hypothetical protein
MTNKNLNDFDKKTRDSADALLSRVPPIEIPSDPIATWEYVVHLALTTDLLIQRNGKSLSLEKRSAIIDWFTVNIYNLKQISVRTLINVRDTFATSSPELVDSDLGLLLKPHEQRSDRQGLPRQDWAALRQALC